MALKLTCFDVAEDLSAYDEAILCHNDDETIASVTMKDDKTDCFITVEIYSSGENCIIMADNTVYTNPDDYPENVIAAIKDGSIWQKTANDDMTVDTSINFRVGFHIYDETEEYYCDNDPFERSMSSMRGESPETLKSFLIEHAQQTFEYHRDELQTLLNKPITTVVTELTTSELKSLGINKNSSKTDIINALRKAIAERRPEAVWIEKFKPAKDDEPVVCRLVSCGSCGSAHCISIEIPYFDWCKSRPYCHKCGAKLSPDHLTPLARFYDRKTELTAKLEAIDYVENVEFDENSFTDGSKEIIFSVKHSVSPTDDSYYPKRCVIIGKIIEMSRDYGLVKAKPVEKLDGELRFIMKDTRKYWNKTN